MARTVAGPGPYAYLPPRDPRAEREWVRQEVASIQLANSDDLTSLDGQITNKRAQWESAVDDEYSGRKQILTNHLRDAEASLGPRNRLVQEARHQLNEAELLRTRVVEKLRGSGRFAQRPGEAELATPTRTLGDSDLPVSFVGGGFAWGTLSYLIALVIAATANVASFYQVLAPLFASSTRTWIVLVLGLMCAVGSLFLMHTAGTEFKRFREHGRTWLSVLSIATWTLLGGGAGLVRLAAPEDTLIGVAGFFAIYLASGVLALIGGYATHDGARGQYAQATSAVSRANSRLTRAERKRNQVVSLIEQIQDELQQERERWANARKEREALAAELVALVTIEIRKRVDDPLERARIELMDTNRLAMLGLADLDANKRTAIEYDRERSPASRKSELEPSEFGPSTVDALTRHEFTTIVSLTRAAFEAAGRAIDSTNEPQLFLPGPVWISGVASPSTRDIGHLREHLSIGRAGFFVYSGELEPEAIVMVDQLRLSGTPVITVSVRALRAAVADDRIGRFLGELEYANGNHDNLFDTRNALIDERFLFGRDRMLNTIGSAIGRDEHVLITGLRKVGKTSLLNILRQHLVEVPVCMVDLQRYDRHTEDWPPILFRSMVAAFDRWGVATAGSGRPHRRLFGNRGEWPFRLASPTSATALVKELDQRLDHVRQVTGVDQRLVVILDELERILPAKGEIEAARQWIRAAGALRALGQGAQRRLVVIGADLGPIANRINDLEGAGTNPWFNLFQEMPLRLLDGDATRTMVESLGRLMGVGEVHPNFHDLLFAWTGGHPSLARTVAGAAYQHRAKSDRLTESDLRRGLEALEDTDRLDFFFRSNLWQLMTEPERRAVRLVARGEVPSAGQEPRVLHEAFAKLRAQGLVNDGGLSIGLLARWIVDFEAGDP